MPSISPESPRNDILALIAEVKVAAAQGIDPQAAFPTPNPEPPAPEKPALPDDLFDDFDCTSPQEVASLPTAEPALRKGRLTNLASKVMLLTAGGAIFAAGSHADELSAVMTNRAALAPAVSSEANNLTIMTSPLPSAEPSVSLSPASLPSPTLSPAPSPSPTEIKLPVAPVVPSVAPSPKPVAPTFVQAKFGRTKVYSVLEEDFNLIAKDISRISHEYHEPLTIARFNGIKDVRSVEVGDKLTYKDCPTNGIMVNVNDTVSEIAEKYGQTTAKLHELNGGAARAVAGWCIRLKLVTTESYPTNPVRK